ncbi:hypothetical protein GCM10023189_58860 [Nibrella saemangeumensis]|uniref:Ceramidase n=1 Tax=Nibrella saemangeumensis TaxID=1084526 RepID=A0ABP8NRZ2_9BACT
MPTAVLSRLILQAGVATILMLIGWAGLDKTLTASVWSAMKVSQSALTVEYCEFNHPQRFFHQPVNTYSNLAYFFFGVLILLVARQDNRYRTSHTPNRLAGFPLLSALMGVCFIYLSIGSAFFHASLTYLGQRVDMNATYSILLTLLGITGYHLGHRIRLSSTQQWLWIAAVLVAIGMFLPLARLVPSARLVPALILLLNAGMVIHYAQFRAQRSIWVVLLSLVLVVLAIYIRTLDVQKVGCDPYSFFQGHALWHLLTALSSFCSYCFFRFNKTPASLAA